MYSVMITTDAQATLDALPDNIQAAVRKGIDVIAENPEHELAEKWSDNIRMIHVTQGITMQYVILDSRMIIIIFSVAKGFLIPLD